MRRVAELPRLCLRAAHGRLPVRLDRRVVRCAGVTCVSVIAVAVVAVCHRRGSLPDTGPVQRLATPFQRATVLPVRGCLPTSYAA